MNIYEKLMAIQMEVKATKDLRNEFGKFNYRSAEMIYEAVKPVCAKYKAVLIVTDMVDVKGDKQYIIATAKLIDTEVMDGSWVTALGWARIPESKKGMDDSQLTGAASSYARKYAMGGLFCLDDNKDADALPPDNKWEEAAEKAQAMLRNKKRLDETENWRLTNMGYEVKMKTGEWKNLDEMELRWLQAMLDDERFRDIKAHVMKKIKEIQG